MKDTKGVQHGGSHDNMPMNTHMLMVPIRLCSPTKRDLRQWQRYLHASLKSFGQTPTQQNKVCSRKKIRPTRRVGLSLTPHACITWRGEVNETDSTKLKQV